MRPTSSILQRLPYLCLAYGCVGLGAAGVVLPVLPTTPFLLVAAWAAPRGSRRLNIWLHRHPQFGPLLRNWRRERAIPAVAKRMALGAMACSWLILILVQAHGLVLAFTALLFLGVGSFIWTRPTPRTTRA